MKKLILGSAAAIMLVCAGCLNHMKAGKVAGSWKVSKIVIHHYDSLGTELNDTTLTDPGFMILEFQDEEEKGGQFELMMDSASMTPCKSYNLLTQYPDWHRYDNLEFGFLSSNDFIKHMSMKVKRLGRVEMDLEYRTVWSNGGAQNYKEEWFLVRGN